ncbi:hypothetical protein Pcinc_025112 [Petrolisthes cinctipes]|uniref:Mutator-like transposase domain-containing protein n=1 Tax=Petrolisthes cinctipes TaxID=88211 RepID=A0AAE1KC16_PETCI|nr:hypothetical protein Pcinc_025112 [Petrolisthes cinctipes]
MGRISHGRRRQRAVMSRVALEHNVRRAEARRRRGQHNPATTCCSLTLTRGVHLYLFHCHTTSSNNVTPLPVSNWETSAALRKSLLATKIPSLSPVCQKKEIINSSVLSDMAHIIKCSVCEGQCVVKRKHLSVESEFTVECDICGNEMYNCRKEKVKIEGHKKLVGQNALSLVYHCMQHDLGYSGMCSLSSCLDIPLMSKGTFVSYENKLEEMAGMKFEEYSKYIIEAIFEYYESELNILPDENGILSVEVTYDGTWMTRGHTSLFGVGAIVEAHTGYIIDGFTSSKYCNECTYWHNVAKKNNSPSLRANLSGYYGTTVRRFVQKGGDKTRVSELASEIMASFLHVTSSDKDPRHFLCPSAEDSWCFYKRALANEETPPSHNTMKVKITITCKEDRQAIALVYQDLTRHDLLERCMKGRTQNVNESFHSKLWKKCVKVKFHGSKKVEFAFKMAALEHNCGYKSGTLLDKILGGDPTARGLNLQEEGRLTSSAKKSLKRRKRRKVEEEGESDYVPGGY